MENPFKKQQQAAQESLNTIEIQDGLTNEEQSIIDSVSKETAEAIKALESGNLEKHKHVIVGVRTEDIFHFLTCMQRGYVEIGKATFTGTHTETPTLYLQINPESDFLNKRDESDKKYLEFDTFGDLAQSNLKMYGKIGFKQAIYRNFLTKGIDLSKLVDDFGEKYDSKQFNTDREVSKEGKFPEEDFVSVWLEDFLDTLYEEVRWVGDDKSKLKELLAFNVLQKHASALISPEDLIDFVFEAQERKGLIIAFSADVLKDREYEIGTAPQDSFSEVIHGGANELAVLDKAGRIDVSDIVGFESMGDYEDEILEKIYSKIGE